MIREIFKIIITWQKKNKNIHTIICMVQWTDGAKKILYNQRGYDYQSYKLTKEDQQEADITTGWMPWKDKKRQ